MKRLIWLPFYTFNNQANIKNEVETEKELISKPQILEDRINEINNTLIYSYKNNLYIKVKYFEYGTIKYYFGFIKKIDLINKFLIIENKRLYFKNILKIDIQN